MNSADLALMFGMLRRQHSTVIMNWRRRRDGRRDRMGQLNWRAEKHCCGSKSLERDRQQQEPND